MKAQLHIKHFKSSLEGINLKTKYLDWQDMIVKLKIAGDIGENACFEHLNRNYAIGLIKKDNFEKYFYSTCKIQNKDSYLNLKKQINKHLNPKWDEMISNLYYSSPQYIYNYLKVDRSRGIRTKQSWERKQDSESVILENISKYMFEHKLYDCQVFIYSQKEPCLNCEMIFQQFIERHSLSELTIFYHQTNYEMLPSKYNWRYV